MFEIITRIITTYLYQAYPFPTWLLYTRHIKIRNQTTITLCQNYQKSKLLYGDYASRWLDDASLAYGMNAPTSSRYRALNNSRHASLGKRSKRLHAAPNIF